MFEFFVYPQAVAAPRGGGGAGGAVCPPPYDFEGEKGKEGKRRKGRKKKRKGRGKEEKKKKKGKKERKKTNKQKTRLWHFACKITSFFIHKSSKILPIGWVPARSLRSLALTHC